jgi:hypothetical protein
LIGLIFIFAPSASARQAVSSAEVDLQVARFRLETLSSNSKDQPRPSA